MEQFSYFVICVFIILVGECGVYEIYDGFLWYQGILFIDFISWVQDVCCDGDFLVNIEVCLDWILICELIVRNGMCNSNVMVIVLIVIIFNIVGVFQFIELVYQNLFVKLNLFGEFIVVNFFLVCDLKVEGLWDNVMVNDLKYFDGLVQQIDCIFIEFKVCYVIVFEIDVCWLVEVVVCWQKWLDQVQSLNLYMVEFSGKKLDVLY